jgi:hypothetical protein
LRGARPQAVRFPPSHYRFLCRQCSQLTYTCQLEQPWQRAFRRANKRANKLWRRLDRISTATAITAGVSAEVLVAGYDSLLEEALLAGTQATQVHTDRLLRLAALIGNRAHVAKEGPNTMSLLDDDFIDRQIERFEHPDGRCYRCGQKADRHAPTGPLTVTVVDGDENQETHEFCDWTCQ